MVQVPVLKIESELKRLVLPLSLTEHREMEEELLQKGGIRGVMTWNGTILVDYEYYDYCHMMEIPFAEIPVYLSCFDEAVAWVCRNQLQRRLLTNEMRKYLIGKRSFTEISLGAHEYTMMRQRTSRRASAIRKRSKYDSSATQTRERIGKEYSLTPGAIRKYEQYALQLDKIRVTAPEFVSGHLAGKYKATIKYIEQIYQLPPQSLQLKCEELCSDSYCLRPGLARNLIQNRMNPDDTAPTVTIKDMPAYDPDAEISSLALTIPSWISTINRVRKSANWDETTTGARERLKNALDGLNDITETMLLEIMEKNDGTI